MTETGTARDAVAAVWRIESARIVGALTRYTGDFELAEDLAQEALAEALVSWPRDGVPSNPAGWLLTVGRRRAIDTPSVRGELLIRLAGTPRPATRWNLRSSGVRATGNVGCWRTSSCPSRPADHRRLPTPSRGLSPMISGVQRRSTGPQARRVASTTT